MSNNNTISLALGILPSAKQPDDIINIHPNKQGQPETQVIVDDDQYPNLIQTTNEDYSNARNNLYEIIHTGLGSIQKLAEIAERSQQARDFEVISTLMNTMIEANKDLLELAAKKQQIHPNLKNTEADRVVNNNLIIGTKELLQLVKKIGDENNATNV